MTRRRLTNHGTLNVPDRDPFQERVKNLQSLMRAKLRIGGKDFDATVKRAGRLLPPHTSPKVWAQNIQDILACPDGYRLMSDAAFDRAQTHLCWTAWADAVANAAQASLTNGATTTAHSLRAVGNA